MNNYIERDVSLDNGSAELQQEKRKNLRNGLIRNREWFKRMIKAQKEYEAMSPEKQALQDDFDRQVRLMHDRQMRESTKPSIIRSVMDFKELEWKNKEADRLEMLDKALKKMLNRGKV